MFRFIQNVNFPSKRQIGPFLSTDQWLVSTACLLAINKEELF